MSDSTTHDIAHEAGDYAPGATYDATPYPRMAHQSTHPMHLCVLGTLMGMQPAPPSKCRYLDVGCAMGTNIVPMALAYPESEFVGIDASMQQIGMGLRDVEAVGASNVSLLAVDLMTLSPEALEELGKFDYIAAHGFYSWVPEAVADRLLEVIGALLAPDGVAFVSYNVYPGWYQMVGLRQMMLYRARNATSDAERIEQARQLLRFVAHAQPADESPFGAWINGFLQYIDVGDDFNNEERDAYLLHDQLETDNRPVFFHEFAAHARRHGLQYVCDAEIESDFPQGFPEGTLDYLREMVRSPEEMQQYMDFARNRMFRRSLVAKDSAQLSRVLRPERLATMRFASPTLPADDEAALATAQPVTFTNHAGLKLTTDHPLSKMAIQCMTRQWPRIFTLGELVACAQQSGMLQVSEQDVMALCVTLMQGFTSGRNVIHILAEPPKFAVQVSERPVGSLWARYELRFGPIVTSLRHERVRLEPLEVETLHLLDGTRTVEDLARHFVPIVRRGDIVFTDTDVATMDDEGLLAHLRDAIGRRINTLSRAAMLEA